MATTGGANTVVDGLVFGYDTGYPLVSGSSDTYKFNKGEPTTTFDVGSMRPTSPNSFFTSSAVYHSNLHGTVWDWTYYPNSNISDDGGMEWHPEVKGPGFKGAWLMKKRPGGNSESNFSGTAPGALDETSSYTVSVWCKTSQASCFRIHINTTQNGSSYWGYGSGYHSGGGGWERLSVTLPANAGNTSMNTIRCQAIGTTITADAYFRNYQVEKNTHPTPFLLGGTRSVSGSLIDLTRTTDIDLSNVSFDSNAQMTFDGTDDIIELDVDDWIRTKSVLSFEGVFYLSADTYGAPWGILTATSPVGDADGFWWHVRYPALSNSLLFRVEDSGGEHGYSRTELFQLNKWYHVVTVVGNDMVKIYSNGELLTSSTPTFQWSNINSDTATLTIAKSWTARMAGNIPIFKLYDRELTAQEILQNYNALKERFKI